jgi:hypothetical protein
MSLWDKLPIDVKDLILHFRKENYVKKVQKIWRFYHETIFDAYYVMAENCYLYMEEYGKTDTLLIYKTVDFMEFLKKHFKGTENLDLKKWQYFFTDLIENIDMQAYEGGHHYVRAEKKIILNLYDIIKKGQKKLHRTPAEIAFWKTMNMWILDSWGNYLHDNNYYDSDSDSDYNSD